MTGPSVVVLADHSVWIAVPAFAPAIVVAAVVGYIAIKNRAKPDADRAEPGEGTQP